MPCIWIWVFFTREHPPPQKKISDSSPSLNPINQGGGALYASPCPLLKKSSGNPYLNIIDFSKLFIADVPMKKGRLHITVLNLFYVCPRSLAIFI